MSDLTSLLGASAGSAAGGTMRVRCCAGRGGRDRPCVCPPTAPPRPSQHRLRCLASLVPRLDGTNASLIPSMLGEVRKRRRSALLWRLTTVRPPLTRFGRGRRCTRPVHSRHQGGERANASSGLRWSCRTGRAHEAVGRCRGPGDAGRWLDRFGDAAVHVTAPAWPLTDRPAQLLPACPSTSEWCSPAWPVGNRRRSALPCWLWPAWSLSSTVRGLVRVAMAAGAAGPGWRAWREEGTRSQRDR